MTGSAQIPRQDRFTRDSVCRRVKLEVSYNDTTKTLNKDLHGGWWDAGDLNKYTNWGASDVIELMHAYAETPTAFTDDTNIPESGNGVADLLDEVKWELDWLGRMQQSDGSVLSVVGEPAAEAPAFGGSPNTAPSTVTDPCDYGPASTSASLTAAAAYALGAGQPDQKSYRDFNDGWPLDSWSVTEPDDGYQAKYIRLLSKFVK